MTDITHHHIKQSITEQAQALGFQQVGITDTDLSQYTDRFQAWITNGYHGSMAYMTKHGEKRLKPDALIPETIRVISVRMDYHPPNTQSLAVLNNPSLGFISRYALGQDYHRLMRKRLQKLAEGIQQLVGEMGYRVFCDSAPVLEKPLAEKAGLGFIGKNTNLINAKAGSWFFLGEIYTDLPLPIDAPITKSHCGSCTACIKVCPTDAIVAPYQLDARRCISYLTIELKGIIPTEFRPLIGNRIYGCDDCQLICPWNKFARFTREDAFHPRHQLDAPKLLELFTWDEATFLKKTEGSAIRRIGHEQWQRNIAVALGNGPKTKEVMATLQTSLTQVSDLVKEHMFWALQQL